MGERRSVTWLVEQTRIDLKSGEISPKMARSGVGMEARESMHEPVGCSIHSGHIPPRFLIFRAQRNLPCWQLIGYSGPNSTRLQDGDSTRKRCQTDPNRRGNEVGMLESEGRGTRGPSFPSQFRFSLVYRCSRSFVNLSSIP